MVLVEDECRVEKEAGIKKIWYPRGKQPIIQVTQEREAQSFYGAMNVKTGQVAGLKTPRQISAYTVKFLRKLEKKYAGKKVLLLWDGAPWHRGKVKEYLKEKNKQWQLELMYFPAYSPDMNPQEKVWKLSRKFCTHNSEDDFKTKINKFYHYLTHRKFNTNFLRKYLK